MELLARARQLEQEFEAKKSELRNLEIKQGVAKEQFVQQKETLAAEGLTFTTGAELKSLYEAQEQRLRALIENYDTVKAQANAQTVATQPTVQPSVQAVTPPPTVQPSVQAVTPPPTVQPSVQAVTPPPTVQPSVQAVTPPPTTVQPSVQAVTPPPTTNAPKPGMREDVTNVFDIDFDGIF